MSARFDPRPEGGGLRERAVVGGLAIVFARFGTQIIRVALTAALARLLTPHDYGLVSIVLAISGFGMVLQDLGLSAATVQRAQVTAGQISVLFWLNLGLGAAIAATGVAAAPLIAAFVDQPDITPIAMALFAGMLIPTLSTQHRALLQRQMRFAEQASIGMISLIVGGTCAVVVALRGGGAWALVALTVASDTVTLALSWRASGFVPTRFRWDEASGAMVRFGGGFLVFRVLGYLAQNLHVILIGRATGVAAAGLFSRAYSTASLLLGYTNEPAGKIAMSALPRCAADPERFARLYGRCLAVMMLAAAPIAAFSWLSAEDLIRVLLGPQWDTAGELLRVLTIGMAVQPVLNSTGWVYIARGEVRGMVVWGVFGWGIMIGAALVGVRWGAHGIAWAWSIALYALLLPCLWAAFKGTRITVASALSITVRPVGAALIAVAAAIPVQIMATDWWVVPRLAACAATFGVAYLALTWFVFGQKTLIADIVSTLRNRRRQPTP